jgi:hypothetical protein
MPIQSSPGAPLNDRDIEKFVLESDIQVGILFKKGDMSMDTFLKVYDMKEESLSLKANRRNVGGPSGTE